LRISPQQLGFLPVNSLSNPYQMIVRNLLVTQALLKGDDDAVLLLLLLMLLRLLLLLLLVLMSPLYLQRARCGGSCSSRTSSRRRTWSC